MLVKRDTEVMENDFRNRELKTPVDYRSYHSLNARMWYDLSTEYPAGQKREYCLSMYDREVYLASTATK